MMCKQQVVQRLKNGRLIIRPCGQCKNCRINDTRAWYLRSRFEIKKEERPFQYFLTLTYNDESLPENNCCDKVEAKKFLNNLNTSFGLRLRYFFTSDYGTINQRAHYHAILLSIKKITQKQVERIWKKGFVYLKSLNVHNLKYTLRYTVKKMPFDKTDKKMFRFISKGWGDNVKEYYTGQEYFLFDGRKYGICAYLKQKLGLDKESAVSYSDFANMVHSQEYKDKVHDNYDVYIQDLIDQKNLRNSYKENIT